MPDDNDDQQFEETSEGFKKLRDAHKRSKAEAKEAREAVTAAEAVKRENAMLRAGVNLDSPVGKLFAKGYDGELDPEAIKAAATEVGATGSPAPSTEETPVEVDDGPTEAEREQQRLRGVLTSDATPPGSEPSPDPWDATYDEFNSPARRTQPRERRAAAAVAQHIFTAANAGDERVVFQKPGEDLADATERWRRSQM